MYGKGLAAGLAGLVLAQSAPYQRAELVLEQAEPGRSTALRINIDYLNPDDPAAKPPAVAKVVETLPPGARIDTSVPEACLASDAQLASMGQSACPAASRVGGGEVELDSGAGTVSFEVTQYNNRNELILLLEQRGGGLRTASRAVVEGSRPDGPRIIAQTPPLPGGPPDGYTGLKRVRLRLDPITRGGRSYVTTPSSCPSDGWTSRIDFTYRDGTAQSVTTRSACSAGTSGRVDLSAPRIAIRGVPRRCASHDLRLKIRIRDRSRLRRAGVRLDGRRLTSGTRKRFRLRIPVRGLHGGMHEVSVSARDERGNLGRRAVRFRRCARAGG